MASKQASELHQNLSLRIESRRLLVCQDISLNDVNISLRMTSRLKCQKGIKTNLSEGQQDLSLRTTSRLTSLNGINKTSLSKGPDDSKMKMSSKIRNKNTATREYALLRY